MIERCSAGHLLKFILAVFAAAVVILLVAQVWYAWTVFAENRRAEHVVAVKIAAATLFTQATRLREQVDGFMERIRAA